MFPVGLIEPLLDVAAEPRDAYLYQDDLLVTGILRKKIGGNVVHWDTLYRVEAPKDCLPVEVDPSTFFNAPMTNNNTEIVARHVPVRNKSSNRVPKHQRTGKKSRPIKLKQYRSYAFIDDRALLPAEVSNRRRKTLGECYNSQRQYMFIHLGPQAFGITEVWKKVVAREDGNTEQSDKFLSDYIELPPADWTCPPFER